MAFVIPFIFTVQYLHLYGSIVDPHCRKISNSNVEQCRCGFGSGSIGSDPAKDTDPSGIAELLEV
jgi:hypothetical protein